MHFTLLLTLRITPFLQRCSCPQLWILLSSELNSPITVHFTSQIPKMMFTLVISCLITSNLPWFINLTFQIPMQYCSLQHPTWLSPPDTSTTGCCFHCNSGPSFLLELFLCSAPIIFCHLLTREFIFQCHMLLHFHTIHGVLKAGILKWFAISFSSGPCFVRTLNHDLSILGGSMWHGLLFHIVWQGCESCDQFWLVFCNCGLHSLCPLIDEDKSLVETFWWEDLSVGWPGFYSGGQGPAQYSSV